MGVYTRKTRSNVKKSLYLSDSSQEDDKSETNATHHNHPHQSLDQSAEDFQKRGIDDTNDDPEDGDGNFQSDGEEGSTPNISLSSDQGSSGMEDHLINVEAMGNSTLLPSNHHIRQILSENSTSTNDPIAAYKLNHEFSPDYLSSDDILTVLEEANDKRMARVTQKYEGFGLPEPIGSKKELLERTKAQFGIVLQILNKEISPSVFHEQAYNILRSSSRKTIAKSDPSFNWLNFVAGYYGFKRQLFVASIVSSQFSADIKRAEGKNSVVKFLTSLGYSTYVLANELILRMMMKDFNCSLKEAEIIALKTQDFGLFVADSTDFDDDLEVGEFLAEEADFFMRDFVRRGFKRGISNTIDPNESYTENDIKKIKTTNSPSNFDEKNTS